MRCACVCYYSNFWSFSLCRFCNLWIYKLYWAQASASSPFSIHFIHIDSGRIVFVCVPREWRRYRCCCRVSSLSSASPSFVYAARCLYCTHEWQEHDQYWHSDTHRTCALCVRTFFWDSKMFIAEIRWLMSVILRRYRRRRRRCHPTNCSPLYSADLLDSFESFVHTQRDDLELHLTQQ